MALLAISGSLIEGVAPMQADVRALKPLPAKI
jgi:hypothetical protein